MKKISRVGGTRRKRRLRLRPWVKKCLKGLLAIVLGVFLIGAFTNNNSSDKNLDGAIADVAVVQAYENVGEPNIVPVVEEVEEPVKEERVNYMCSDSSVKTYMDYRAITDKSSNQYRYIQAHMTVGADGFLYDKDGSIGVALGSHFGPIGSKWEIVLDTGITFKAVKIDEKADRHVYNGCQHKQDGSVIEFVIDSRKFEKASNGYVWQGNFNNNPDFKGKISAMYKVD